MVLVEVGDDDRGDVRVSVAEALELGGQLLVPVEEVLVLVQGHPGEPASVVGVVGVGLVPVDPGVHQDQARGRVVD